MPRGKVKIETHVTPGSLDMFWDEMMVRAYMRRNGCSETVARYMMNVLKKKPQPRQKGAPA